MTTTPTSGAADLPEALIHAGMQALLQCSASELENLSPMIFETYSDDVQRVFAAMTAQAINPGDTETGPEGEWYCETHPDQLMGHNGCGGAGIPACARIACLMNQLRLTNQEVREAGRMRDEMAFTALRVASHGQAPAQAAPAYKDSTPELHVGDSAFESWYSTYSPVHKSDKQRARDAYAAGMGDPLVMAAPAAVAGPSDDMVLAAARVISPSLFSHGLKPLPKDSPHIALLMLKEAALVSRMLDAALAAAAPKQAPSHTSMQLAEVVLSDCGHSSNYTPLLERVAARIDAHVERILGDAPAPASQADALDAARLDWLRDNSCDLRCVDSATGQGDGDIHWIVIEHHMTAPVEREIGRAYRDDPRAAIDAARAAHQEGEAP